LAASGPGNDHRLGANEAPPAIISVFMGEVIENILLTMADKSSLKLARENAKFSPLNNLAYMPKDNTDRNRTSPFAFTGNKFEFRMLGSSLSASSSATVIATILADVLREIADRLDDYKYLQDVREEALKIVQEIMRAHHRVLYSGDGYSKEWVEEAARRGLPNITSFVESIEYMLSDKTVALYERNNVYTRDELEARAAIRYEQYIKTIQVESKTMLDMVERQVIPAASDYLLSILPLKGLSYHASRIKKIEKQLEDADTLISELKAKLDQCAAIESHREEGLAYRKEIVPMLDALRETIDTLEVLLPEDVYPFPSYTDLWFRID
jgi:glutamine synthetase